MNNRCKRCNRELSDPNADYGWRCAQILGVSNQLSKMKPEAFERFLSGISKADKLMGNADFNSEQKNGMYKSYAKMALWDGIDKNKVAEAKKDSFAAAGGRKSNTNLAEELSQLSNRWDNTKRDPYEYDKPLDRASQRLNDKGKLDDITNALIKIHDIAYGRGLSNTAIRSLSRILLLGEDLPGAVSKSLNLPQRLVHAATAKKNYEDNKSVKLDSYDDNYINDQNSGQIKNVKYGLRTNLLTKGFEDNEDFPLLKNTMDNNGCEVIAVYNSLKTLGKPEDIRDIAKHFENDGQMLGGYFGTNPYAAGRFFKRKGYKVKTVVGEENILDKPLPKADSYIITFYNSPKVTDAIHTVSFRRKTDGNYEVYNYDSSEESYETPNIRKHLKNTERVPLVLLCISK